MRRSGLLALWMALSLASVAGAAAGTPGAEPGSDAPPMADHLGGSFTACGRLSAFTAPVPGTPGSLTIEGVIAYGPHTFPIDEAAAVDGLLPGLAAAGDWTCLDLVGDGMGVLISLAIPGSSTQCGSIESTGGAVLGQRAGSTHELTTIVLDGDAATVITTDADLSNLLPALAKLLANPFVFGTAEACLKLSFAADGALSNIDLDYDQPGGSNMAVIACGQVDGTALEYRDPASQPYPPAGLVSVEGFELDATLLDPALHEVLSFDLDAGQGVCLTIEVVDTVIVEAAVRTGWPGNGPVCGKLEVIDGLVFVDRVVVAQGLMALDFAEPTPSSIASACADVSAQEGAAVGRMEICGDFQGVTQDTLAVSGVTFHFAAPVAGVVLPEPDGLQAIGIDGPFPLEPFGAANPVRFANGFLPCIGEVPNAEMAPHGPSLPMLVWLALSALLCAGLLGRRVASTR